MSGTKGWCKGFCKEFKTLYYNLGTKWEHCHKCHTAGFRKNYDVKHETQDEYFERLKRQIVAKHGKTTYTEEELGPKSEVIEAIYNKPPSPPESPRVVSEQTDVQIKARLEREALTERKRLLWLKQVGDKHLDALRLANRLEMDKRRANYTPRRSLTPLQPPKS